MENIQNLFKVGKATLFEFGADIKTLMNAIHERLNSAQKNATSASVLSLDKTKIEFTSELAATAMSVYSLLPTMAISSDATPVVLMM